MQASYAAREPRCYGKRIAANDVARKSKFIMLASRCRAGLHFPRINDGGERLVVVVAVTRDDR
jgi:hypothetical protein